MKIWFHQTSWFERKARFCVWIGFETSSNTHVSYVIMVKSLHFLHFCFLYCKWTIIIQNSQGFALWLSQIKVESLDQRTEYLFSCRAANMQFRWGPYEFSGELKMKLMCLRKESNRGYYSTWEYSTPVSSLWLPENVTVEFLRTTTRVRDEECRFCPECAI